jgi:hypothetical protein
MPFEHNLAAILVINPEAILLGRRILCHKNVSLGKVRYDQTASLPHRLDRLAGMGQHGVEGKNPAHDDCRAHGRLAFA